jgi:hypothetical protein
MAGVICSLLTGRDVAGGECQDGNNPSPTDVAVALVGNVRYHREQWRHLLAGAHAAAHPVARRASCKIPYEER